MGLLSSFFGRDQKKDLLSAQQEANQQIDAARNEANRATESYTNQALEQYAPYRETGDDALAQYRTLIGLDGAEARGQAYDALGEPAGLDEAMDYSARKYAAAGAGRGLLGAGDFAAASQQALGRERYGAFQSDLDRIYGLAGMGYGTAGQSAGLLQGAGQQIAGTQMGAGQLFANNAINTGNAMAQARSVPINNLLATGQLIASAATGMPVGSGSPGAGQPTGGTPTQANPWADYARQYGIA